MRPQYGASPGDEVIAAQEGKRRASGLSLGVS
jgi:hypothetical protein